MKSNEVLSSIKVYMCEKDTDYAILINGGWGSGKTYFIKNKLIENLIKQNEKQVIYISLFGLKSVEEILQNISFHVANILANERAIKKATINSNQNINPINTSDSITLGFWSKLFSDSISLFPKGAQLNAIITKITSGIISFDKYIFCFDDFERTIIPCSELLGLIDSLAGQINVKTIIVANEEKIIQKNKKNYWDFKEKVVGLTINFESNINEVFEDVLNKLELEPNTNKFINDNKHLIIETFEKLESKNIRTLKFALRRFEELLKKIEEYIDGKGYSEQNKKNFWEILLIRCVNMSIVLKDIHRNVAEIKWAESQKLQEYNCIDKTGFYWEFKSSMSLGSSIWGAKFIDDYLVKYRFVDKEMIRVVDDVMNRYKRMENMHEFAVLKEVYYCESDACVEKNFNIVMKKLEEDKYDIDDYDAIIDICFELAEKYFDDASIKDNIKKYTKKNLKKSIEELYKWQNSVLFSNKEAREYSIELQKEVSNNIKCKLNKELEKITEPNKNFIEKIKKFEKEHVNNGMYEENKFFSSIDSEGLKNFLLFADHKSIIDFNGFIWKFNQYHNIKKRFTEDIETLQELVNVGENILKCGHGSKIRKMNIRILVKTLNEILS